MISQCKFVARKRIRISKSKFEKNSKPNAPMPKTEAARPRFGHLNWILVSDFVLRISNFHHFSLLSESLGIIYCEIIIQRL